MDGSSQLLQSRQSPYGRQQPAAPIRTVIARTAFGGTARACGLASPGETGRAIQGFAGTARACGLASPAKTGRTIQVDLGLLRTARESGRRRARTEAPENVSISRTARSYEPPSGGNLNNRFTRYIRSEGVIVPTLVRLDGRDFHAGIS
jgi:hypothetical protein